MNLLNCTNDFSNNLSEFDDLNLNLIVDYRKFITFSSSFISGEKDVISYLLPKYLLIRLNNSHLEDKLKIFYDIFNKKFSVTMLNNVIRDGKSHFIYEAIETKNIQLQKHCSKNFFIYVFVFDNCWFSIIMDKDKKNISIDMDYFNNFDIKNVFSKLNIKETCFFAKCFELSKLFHDEKKITQMYNLNLNKILSLRNLFYKE